MYPWEHEFEHFVEFSVYSFNEDHSFYSPLGFLVFNRSDNAPVAQICLNFHVLSFFFIPGYSWKSDFAGGSVTAANCNNQLAISVQQLSGNLISTESLSPFVLV